MWSGYLLLKLEQKLVLLFTSWLSLNANSIVQMTVHWLMVVWALTMARCVCEEAQMWSLTLSRFNPWGTKWRSYSLLLLSRKIIYIGTWWNVSFWLSSVISQMIWRTFESWAMNSACKRIVTLQGTLPNHHLEPEVFQGEGFWCHWPKKKKNYNTDSAVLLFLYNMQVYVIS